MLKNAKVKDSLSLNLIIGSRGFIGHNLTLQLQREQKMFHALPTYESYSDFIAVTKKAYLDSLSNIIWVAGKASPSNTKSRQDHLFTMELSGLNNLLKFLSHNQWSGKLIFLSSGGCIYKTSSLPLNEECELAPNNYYGELKLEQESLIISSQVRHSILRVSNVYGYRESLKPGKDVISTWLHNALNKETCQVFGDLSSYRDYINISDLVMAISLATQPCTSNNIINIGSGIRISTSELIEIFSRASKETIHFDFQTARDFDRKGFVLDIYRANEVLGWKPKSSMKRDLLEMLAGKLNH